MLDAPQTWPAVAPASWCSHRTLPLAFLACCHGECMLGRTFRTSWGPGLCSAARSTCSWMCSPTGPPPSGLQPPRPKHALANVRTLDAGLRVEGLGLRVQGLGFRVQGCTAVCSGGWDGTACRPPETYTAQTLNPKPPQGHRAAHPGTAALTLWLFPLLTVSRLGMQAREPSPGLTIAFRAVPRNAVRCSTAGGVGGSASAAHSCRAQLTNSAQPVPHQAAHSQRDGPKP